MQHATQQVDVLGGKNLTFLEDEVDAFKKGELPAVFIDFEIPSAIGKTWEIMANDPSSVDPWHSPRSRQFSQFHVFKDPDGAWQMELLPHRPHIQPIEFNQAVGGIARLFKPLSFSPDLGPMVDLLPPTDDPNGWEVTFHRWRMHTVTDGPTESVPERRHRDGHEYVMIGVVGRHNIEVGSSFLYFPTGPNPKDPYGMYEGGGAYHRPGDMWGAGTLRENEGVLLDDTAVLHDVTSIVPEDTTHPGYRDIFVATFNSWARRNYGPEFEAWCTGEKITAPNIKTEDKSNHFYLDLAKEAASAAVEIIQTAKKQSRKVSLKSDNSFVTDTDLACERAIVEILSKGTPGFGMYGEEGIIPRSRRYHTWIVDPLDGTHNFGYGLPLYAVQIALEHQGEVITGVIALPSENLLLHACKGSGCFVNNERTFVSQRPLNEGLFMLDSRWGDPDFALMRSMKDTAHDVRVFNSSCVTMAYIALGRANAVIDYGSKPWDLAAGSLLVKEAGGTVTNLNGGPFYIYQPRCIASNGPDHATIVDIVARTGAFRNLYQPSYPKLLL